MLGQTLHLYKSQGKMESIDWNKSTEEPQPRLIYNFFASYFCSANLRHPPKDSSAGLCSGESGLSLGLGLGVGLGLGFLVPDHARLT